MKLTRNADFEKTYAEARDILEAGTLEQVLKAIVSLSCMIDGKCASYEMEQMALESNDIAQEDCKTAEAVITYSKLISQRIYDLTKRALELNGIPD